MLRSIQEFLRKINTFLKERLTFIDFIGIIGTIFIVSVLFITLTVQEFSSRKEITYTESASEVPKSGQNMTQNTPIYIYQSSFIIYMIVTIAGRRSRASSAIYPI